MLSLRFVHDKDCLIPVKWYHEYSIKRKCALNVPKLNIDTGKTNSDSQAKWDQGHIEAIFV